MLIPPVESKKSEKQLSLLFFPMFFLIFFGILKNAKDEKLNMPWKRRKIK
jgi:hypothetical protein